MTIKLSSCSQFKKITVITDPINPEQDLLKQADNHGEVMCRITCDDGFVYLVRLAEFEPDLS